MDRFHLSMLPSCPIVRPLSLVALLTIFVNLIGIGESIAYGRACDHDDDCHDFRLGCSISTNSCVCTRFFDWDGKYKACQLNMTELKGFLAALGDERDYREELDAHAHSTFNQLGFAGLLALSLGLLGALGCVVLFCIVGRNFPEVG